MQNIVNQQQEAKWRKTETCDFVTRKKNPIKSKKSGGRLRSDDFLEKEVESAIMKM